MFNSGIKLRPPRDPDDLLPQVPQLEKHRVDAIKSLSLDDTFRVLWAIRRLFLDLDIDGLVTDTQKLAVVDHQLNLLSTRDNISVRAEGFWRFEDYSSPGQFYVFRNEETDFALMQLNYCKQILEDTREYVLLCMIDFFQGVVGTDIPTLEKSLGRHPHEAAMKHIVSTARPLLEAGWNLALRYNDQPPIYQRKGDVICPKTSSRRFREACFSPRLHKGSNDTPLHYEYKRSPQDGRGMFFLKRSRPLVQEALEGDVPPFQKHRLPDDWKSRVRYEDGLTQSAREESRKQPW